MISKNENNQSNKMDLTINRLVRQLSSDNLKERESALGKLIEIGLKSVNSLKATLNSADPEIKALAMEGLAMIADSSCHEEFLAGINDNFFKVRAWAAQGLARIHSPEAVDALIKTLHDYPDEGHGQYTLSAYALIGMGKVALPDIVPLLSDKNVFSREQAFKIISDIVTNIPEFANQWESLWKELGSYDPNSAPEIHQRAAKKWMAWVKKL